MTPEEVFYGALERKTPEERAAYLDGACAGNARLREQVEMLLRHGEEAQGFLETLFVEQARPAASERPGSMIGRYKLLQEIGEGGFGVVYMAEQSDPVRRNVALKIIKLGMDTQEVVARFEAERQALAMMDHPNIAKVLDAGATETGRPYFVMELVHGVPITQYADASQLSPQERLDLFSQVCNAIQHAHQKGIIHRDIKPSNILVTLHDGVPVPKVIDFGIAKATNVRLTEKTLFTRFGQFVGTPAYMSPEQAEMSGLDVDTRSDIYSLGVLLYELLTGTTPLDPESLRNAAHAELQRMIREVDPPKPSTRVSTMKDRLPSVAARRRTEPAKLSALMRGDLDWIVMKCLEKDRTRRYETASSLSMDIQRHLTGEAVMAAPPSRAYSLRKFVRRNRGPVLAAGLVAAALLLGTLGTTWGMFRAEARWKEVEDARASEAKQRAEADRAHHRVEAIHELLMKTLKTSDPHASGRQGMLVVDAMKQAMAAIDAGELRDDPETEAELCATIAEILNGNGRSEDALPLAERALRMQEALHPQGSAGVVAALGNLAAVLSFLGQDDRAGALNERALELTRRVAPQDQQRLMGCLFNLAGSRREVGRREDAEALYAEALEICRKLYPGDDRRLAAALNGLATAREFLGRFSEAESLFHQALAMRQRLFKADHPDVIESMAGLGRVLRDQGRPGDAEALARQILEALRRQFGGDNPHVAVALCDLAATLDAMGRSDEVESLYRQALEMRRRLYRGDHPDIARNLSLLGEFHLGRKQLAEAETLFAEALDMKRRLFPGGHQDVVEGLNSLAVVRGILGKLAEAEAMLREAVEMAHHMDKGQNPRQALVLHHLADVLVAQGRFGDALEPARKAAAMYLGHPDWAPREAAHADSVLLMSLLATQAPPGEAAEAGRRLLALQRKLLPPGSLELSGTLAMIGSTLEKLETLDAAREAEVCLRECLEIRARAMPGDWRVSNTKSLLGGAIAAVAERDAVLPLEARRERFRDAEKLVLEAWAEMKDDARVPPPQQNGGADRKREALERVVRLYEAWDRVDPGKGFEAKAAEWRGRLPPGAGTEPGK